MPMYEFECQRCNNDEVEWDIYKTLEEAENNPPICPACGEEMARFTVARDTGKHFSWQEWAVGDNARRKV